MAEKEMAPSLEGPQSKIFGRGTDEGRGVDAAAPPPRPAKSVRGGLIRGSQSMPPVILLGGDNNVLSVAGSLSKAGIKV
jgi:hypothetical protein